MQLYLILLNVSKSYKTVSNTIYSVLYIYIYIYIYIYGSLLVIYFNYEFMRVCIKLNLRKHF